jgi:hypothetical protein
MCAAHTFSVYVNGYGPAWRLGGHEHDIFGGFSLRTMGRAEQAEASLLTKTVSLPLLRACKICWVQRGVGRSGAFDAFDASVLTKIDSHNVNFGQASTSPLDVQSVYVSQMQ